jgi:hypothetical protein
MLFRDAEMYYWRLVRIDISYFGDGSLRSRLGIAAEQFIGRLGADFGSVRGYVKYLVDWAM